MEKIGDYQYPNTKITGALELVRAFRDKLKGVSNNKNALANAFGYKSANNGAFTHKTMDLRRYGLIEGRGDEIKLSELAKKLLSPHSKQEENDATKEMILNVPLYREIYEKYGASLPTDFGAALQNITHADRLQVDAIKDRISKLYIDAVSKLSNEISNEGSANMGGQYGQQGASESSIPLDKEAPLSFSAEGISIRVKNDEEHLKRASAFINLFLKGGEKEGKKKPTDKDASDT